MVSARATRLRSKTTTLIAKYGESATLYTTTSAYNTATSENVVTETAVAVTVSPPDSPVRNFSPEGNAIKGGEGRFLVAGAGVVPAPGMEILLDSHRWTITMVNPYSVDGDEIVYRMEIDK
jgi:hypothetical protein